VSLKLMWEVLRRGSVEGGDCNNLETWKSMYVYRNIETRSCKNCCSGKAMSIRGQLKCDGTREETRFRLLAKWTSPFKSAAGCQFSRQLAAEVCASAVVMLVTPCSEVVWRVLATHSIRQFPLHFPSLRHRVPSHFKWSLLLVLEASWNVMAHAQ